MAQVEIRINDRPYRIACDDGQEAHLRQLADQVDRRVQDLVAAVGQVGDDRLLVMVSLLLADELSETAARLADADAAGEEEARAAAVEALAERIERITSRLQPA